MVNYIKVRKTNFLPNFCSAEILLIIVLSTQLLAIILALTPPLSFPQVLFNLALNSLFIQWITLSCAALLCLLRRYISNFSDQQAAIISYLLIIAVAAIITEIAWWSLYVYPEQVVVESNAHLMFLMRCIGISAIVAAVVLRYLYVQHQWRKHIEAAASARYQAMQSKIRPHFLFNCMNTISSLIQTSPKLAEQAVLDLADLFRASLSQLPQLYNITHEWDICKTYLRIEKQRLADYLTVTWDIAELPSDAQVPPLSLQPLVENAIYHGIAQLSDGGTITITGSFEQQLIKITITNPVPASNQHLGHSVAQDNIRQRLTALFGSNSDLISTRDNDLYSVAITLPYIRDENPDC